MATEQPIIVIVGPTASGKTSLSIEIAKRFDGEVICADSRTVYREMDIGTAKPTLDERGGIAHWGLDNVSPHERYTAGSFQIYAQNAIKEIRHRGKTPIIVGGTGLYIDGLIFDYDYPSPPSEKDRQRFESMTKNELYEYCIENNIDLHDTDRNPRHVLKAIYTHNSYDKRKQHVEDDMIIVGIATNKQSLDKRIALRTEQMFADGVVEEAKLLGKKYGWQIESMTSNVYRSIKLYLDNKCSLEEAKNDFIIRDRQLAKRQMTWFRRNPYIMWGSKDEILDYLEADTRL